MPESNKRPLTPEEAAARKARIRRKKRRKRQRQIRMIVTCIVLLLVAISALVVGNEIHRNRAKSDSAKAAKAAEIEAEERLIEAKRTAISEAETIASTYDYDGAIAYLQTIDGADSDSEIMNEISKLTAEKSTLEAKDPLKVPHIFYHSLIVDPTRCFDVSKWGEDTVAGNNAWMTTIPEFDKITQQMYDNGWILIRMRDLVTSTTNADGSVTFAANKSLLLPADKHPYVLSIDDWSYYHSYEGKGYGDKAVLDENGEVKVQYTDANGNVSVGDYDVVPRLNSFIEEHPDASYRGARGLIAMTGYNGVFGYRTDVAYDTHERLGQDQAAWLEAHPDFNYEQEIEEAKKIAEAVKASGWEFACHTWGHLSVTDKSVETLATDQEKWQNTVANITGKVDTIIFAHGNDIGSWKPYNAETNAVYAYFKSMGYNFYANVDASNEYWVQIQSDFCRMGRIDCDGLQMWRALSGSAKTNVFEKLFDVASVFDSVRPTPVSATGKA